MLWKHICGFDLHQTNDKTIYTKLLAHEIIPRDGNRSLGQFVREQAEFLLAMGGCVPFHIQP